MGKRAIAKAAGRRRGGKGAPGDEHREAPTRGQREIFREGEVPVLDISVELPSGDAFPDAVVNYYGALENAYREACRERLLPAARAALLSLPEKTRRFGFRRFRFSVRFQSAVRGAYLLVTRVATLNFPGGTQRREVCEVFTLPDGRLTPPLLFLRGAVGRLPRGARRFRRATLTLSGDDAVLAARGGRTLRVPLADPVAEDAETGEAVAATSATPQENAAKATMPEESGGKGFRKRKKHAG